MEWMSLFGIALVTTVIIMFVAWIWAVKIDNFGIVDAIWAFCFFLHAIIFYSFSNGYPGRNVLLLSMIGLWSLRLCFFLTKRLYGLHPEEDTRYQHLRAEYKNKFKFKFLIFYFYQAISVSVLTLPFIFVFKNQNQGSLGWEMAGGLYWLISLTGESIADFQMSQFKKLSKSHPEMGRTCNIGLWKYSRHPNYFFESNIWLGFFIFMIGSGVYWGVYSALIILFLLLKVTGVPPSEEQSLKTRGEEYRRYQKVTSVFIPLPNKK